MGYADATRVPHLHKSRTFHKDWASGNLGNKSCMIDISNQRSEMVTTVSNETMGV